MARHLHLGFIAVCVCACHAGVTVRGTVTAAEVAGHGSEQAPHGAAGEPVRGAHVAVYATPEAVACEDSGAQLRSGGPAWPEERTTTDDAGHYGPIDIIPLGGMTDTWVSVCVTHPDYGPQGVSDRWGDAGAVERYNGTRDLDFRLHRRDVP